MTKEQLLQVKVKITDEAAINNVSYDLLIGWMLTNGWTLSTLHESTMCVYEHTSSSFDNGPVTRVWVPKEGDNREEYDDYSYCIARVIERVADVHCVSQLQLLEAITPI